jgi:hypothetical protein
MGASGWEYYVPYQVDVTAALRDLQAQAFERGATVWHGEWQPERSLIPATLDQLWQDQRAQTEGTHSILGRRPCRRSARLHGQHDDRAAAD